MIFGRFFGHFKILLIAFLRKKEWGEGVSVFHGPKILIGALQGK